MTYSIMDRFIHTGDESQIHFDSIQVPFFSLRFSNAVVYSVYLLSLLVLVDLLSL
jgi:hypothetical protein